MPYKGLESFKIKETCVKSWAEDLNPSTARNYVYYFLNYLDWIKNRKHWMSAQAMLDDYSKSGKKKQIVYSLIQMKPLKSR